MSTLDMAMQRIAVLEARVAALESSKAPAAQQSSPGVRQTSEPLSDDMLHKSWADKRVKRDPPKWGGESKIGMLYSQVESDWHESNAGFCDWKAAKGAAEVPVRCNKEGKPWHESDTFEAKLCRAWARRNQGGVAPQAVKSTVGDYDYGTSSTSNYDGDIPF